MDIKQYYEELFAVIKSPVWQKFVVEDLNPKIQMIKDELAITNMWNVPRLQGKLEAFQYFANLEVLVEQMLDQITAEERDVANL